MATKKALIVGATGLIGGYCLQALLKDPAYAEVIALVRSPQPMTHPKLKTVYAGFDNLEPALAGIEVHDVFCCLGTTIKKAGSQQAFREVDFTLVLTIAELMRKKGAIQFLVISSMGADKNAKVFYSRVKGEMETALKHVGYPCLRIIRPSLLLGPRKEFRLGEKVGTLLTPVLQLFLRGPLGKYRPVQAEAVARFMVMVAHQQPSSGVHVYESDMICQPEGMKRQKEQK